MKYWFYLFILYIFPVSLQAAITINEVAWMGDSVSANNEWIELRNDGTSADVTNWTLTDGANLTITLEGSIPSNSFAVLERTSETAAPGAAFLIYTGALVNTGATLVLRNAEGSIVDQVAGGEGWKNIGGDNATKETAQYSTQGWITAPATPGQQNATQSTSNNSDTTNNTETTNTISSKSSTGNSAKLAPKVIRSDAITELTLPPNSLSLRIDPIAYGYVHQELLFTVNASGTGDTILNSLQYDWNFGDGTSAAGKESRHSYEYPGTYVVSVFAEYGRQHQEERMEITILPVTLSLTKNSSGDIQINNDSPYEIDMSGYVLKGETAIEFPPRTILLPNQTITIPYRKIAQSIAPLVVLYDAKNNAVASNMVRPQPLQVVGAEMSSYTPRTSTPYVSARETPPTSAFTFSSSKPIFEEEIPMVVNDTVSEVAFEQSQTEPLWPYFTMIIIFLLVSIGLIATKQRNQTE